MAHESDSTGDDPFDFHSIEEIQKDLDRLAADRVIYEATSTVRNDIFTYGVAKGLVAGIFVSSGAFIALGAYEITEGRTATGYIFTGLGAFKAVTTAIIARPGLRQLRKQTQ